MLRINKNKPGRQGGKAAREAGGQAVGQTAGESIAAYGQRACSTAARLTSEAKPRVLTYAGRPMFLGQSRTLYNVQLTGLGGSQRQVARKALRLESTTSPDTAGTADLPKACQNDCCRLRARWQLRPGLSLRPQPPSLIGTCGLRLFT